VARNGPPRRGVGRSVSVQGAHRYVAASDNKKGNAMSSSFPFKAGVVLASISAAALLADATAASAQPYDQPPPPNYDQGYNQAPPPDYDQGYDQGRQGYQDAPPPGQYAPPPPNSYQQQQYDQDYGRQYSAWAAQYCVDRRNNNTAAGAVIGGVLGSIIGSGVAGRGSHFAGAVVGGAVGATAGAAIGSSSTDMRGCPPGYIVASGAPAFVYSGGYAPGFYAPAWYHPWVWSSGRWMYRPYRTWYREHPRYWRRRY
jgi:hypothetical protein